MITTLYFSAVSGIPDNSVYINYESYMFLGRGNKKFSYPDFSLPRAHGDLVSADLCFREMGWLDKEASLTLTPC